MPPHTVGSWADILSLPVLAPGDNVTMSSNFSTTDNENKLSLNGASFNGSSYTLTWGVGRTTSIFINLSGGVIENLTIDASNIDITNEIYLLHSGSNFGTIRNVDVINGGTLFVGSACITGEFGDISNKSFIEDCTVNIFNTDNVCAGICTSTINTDISRCTVNFDTHTSGGGIVFAMKNDTTIDSCEVNINNSGLDFHTGVVYILQGDQDGNHNICTIKNTFVNWIGPCGTESSGIVRELSTYYGHITLNITDCHTNYNNSSGSGFVHKIITSNYNISTLNLTSCYISEPSINYPIVKSFSNSYDFDNTLVLNLDGVYTNGGTSFSPTDRVTVNNIDNSSFLSISNIKDTLIKPDRWVTNNSTFAMRNPGLPVINIIIPCFLPGTMIRTANGDVPIEKLSSNDLVTTTQGEKNIIEKIVIKCNDSKIQEHEKPVCFTKGCLGNNLPSKDLWASRFHKILYNGEMICANELFLRKDPVSDTIVDTFDNKVTGVIYHHLVLEGNYPYYANDVVAESAGNSESHSILEDNC
jgi:hypothetical protein